MVNVKYLLSHRKDFVYLRRKEVWVSGSSSFFNIALLAKQAWKIEQNPESLLARLYKGRYSNSSTFLQSSSSTTSSYGWIHSSG